MLPKMPNKAVITGGHRSDIQIAALETSTKCHILTGDQNPGEVVLGKAMMARVPILVVREDTLSTVEKVERVLGKIHFREHQSGPDHILRNEVMRS